MRSSNSSHLHTLGGEPGAGPGAEAVDAALGRLAEGSLLAFTVDGQVVTAHRLVLRVVRERLAQQGQLAAVCQAAAEVLHARAAILAGSPGRLAAWPCGMCRNRWQPCTRPRPGFPVRPASWSRPC